MNKKITVVVPFLNEDENLHELYRRLSAVFSALEAAGEFLFVDDGSTDGSVALLKSIQHEDPRVRVLRLSRNFGHQAAVTAGLAYAKGDAVVVLDSDLQDPPEVIPAMIAKWSEGYDVVYGIRCKRKERALLRAAYFLFYRIMRRVTSFDIPVDAGDFALMSRRLLDVMNRLPEKQRFVRGLRGWVGYKQIGIPYERDGRRAGCSKYSLAQLFKLAMDGIIAYSTIPLRVAVWIGAGSAIGGLGYFLFVIYARLVLAATPSGWSSLASIMLVFGGVQLLVLGIIGEYIGRIYEEVKGRPSYIVEELLEAGS